MTEMYRAIGNIADYGCIVASMASARKAVNMLEQHGEVSDMTGRHSLSKASQNDVHLGGIRLGRAKKQIIVLADHLHTLGQWIDLATNHSLQMNSPEFTTDDALDTLIVRFVAHEDTVQVRDLEGNRRTARGTVLIMTEQTSYSRPDGTALVYDDGSVWEYDATTDAYTELECLEFPCTFYEGADGIYTNIGGKDLEIPIPGRPECDRLREQVFQRNCQLGLQYEPLPSACVGECAAPSLHGMPASSQPDQDTRPNTDHQTARTRPSLGMADAAAHKSAQTDPSVAVASFRTTTDYRTVWVQGEELHLTKKEAKAIMIFHQAYLAGHPVVSTKYVLGQMGEAAPARFSEIFRRRTVREKLLKKFGKDQFRLNI